MERGHSFKTLDRCETIDAGSCVTALFTNQPQLCVIVRISRTSDICLECCVSDVIYHPLYVYNTSHGIACKTEKENICA